MFSLQQHQVKTLHMSGPHLGKVPKCGKFVTGSSVFQCNLLHLVDVFGCQQSLIQDAGMFLRRRVIRNKIKDCGETAVNTEDIRENIQV